MTSEKKCEKAKKKRKVNSLMLMLHIITKCLALRKMTKKSFSNSLFQVCRFFCCVHIIFSYEHAFKPLFLYIRRSSQVSHFFPPLFCCFFLSRSSRCCHRTYSPDNYNPIFFFFIRSCSLSLPVFCLIRWIFVHAHMKFRLDPIHKPCQYDIRE